jgi:hypothetical protein
MEFKANAIRLQYDSNRKAEIILSTNLDRIDISKEQEIINKGKLLAVEVKQHRQKRSLDANAYLWVMLQKMSEVLQTSKDELYLLMLDRYGVFTHIIVKPNMVDMVKQEWRTVRELGEVTVNNKTGVQLQCFFGSSTYDTKQMSTLISGVVSECHDLGIETLPPDEIANMNSQWGMKGE